VVAAVRPLRASLGPGSPTGWLLIVSADGWTTLLAGQAATVRHGLLASSSRRDLTVAVLRVRDPPGLVAAPPW
jgi:competence protein ComEC